MTAALLALAFVAVLVIALAVTDWMERRENAALYGGINERAELRRALADPRISRLDYWDGTGRDHVLRGGQVEPYAAVQPPVRPQQEGGKAS